MSFKIMPYGGQQYKGDYANHRDINQYFGFEPGEKVPASFMAHGNLPLTDGRRVRAIYDEGHVSTTGWRGKTAKHRVTVQCPDCKAWVPAGRTHQHKCKS